MLIFLKKTKPMYSENRTMLLFFLESDKSLIFLCCLWDNHIILYTLNDFYRTVRCIQRMKRRSSYPCIFPKLKILFYIYILLSFRSEFPAVKIELLQLSKFICTFSSHSIGNHYRSMHFIKIYRMQKYREYKF